MFRLIALWILFSSSTAIAQEAAKVTAKMAFLSMEESKFLPLSLLDPPIDDFGLPGAQLALKENQTTGTFLGHSYELVASYYADNAALVDNVRALLSADVNVFIADLELEQWRALANAGLLDNGLFLNTRSRSDVIRGEECHANLLHLIPSYQLLADGLAQYLIFKKWDEWLLLHGKGERDLEYTQAINRSAKKFRAKIVDQLEWQFEAGSRRTDSGHVTAQREVPLGTQTRKSYDVLVVADEYDHFGEYLPHATAQPRPVVGTHGLISTAWHRVNENWGATQVQRRFSKAANDRYMTPRDYAAWVAVRAIGEAVTRMEKGDAASIREYLMSPTFNLAAFKGVPVSFRHWNGQLRQPILLAGPRVLVSVSPQKQFLHERNVLDSMGVDDVESACKAFA